MQKPLLNDGSADLKPGLYANINAKRDRIVAGSKEKMRKPGAPGAQPQNVSGQRAQSVILWAYVWRGG